MPALKMAKNPPARAVRPDISDQKNVLTRFTLVTSNRSRITPVGIYRSAMRSTDMDFHRRPVRQAVANPRHRLER